jgi:hypothetical protein
MKTFWSAVLKGAVWVAHYAADHPDQVVAAVKAVQDAKR